MEFTSVLYQFIFMPLQLLFEYIYYLIGWKVTNNPGLSIIILSLTVNLLVLPLYNRADAVQEEEKAIEKKLRKGIEHIKKSFKGDEQMMILQTYYRQNDYSPIDSIKGSISLFLEIPFFVAAYQFLSNLSVLQGTKMGPIVDLSLPDGLLQIAGMQINILPILMTVINLAATFLFVDGMSRKTKIQLYGLAFFFFVFLYKSPSGLVFYWTLNNLFNLVKTMVYKRFGTPKVELEASNTTVPDTSKGLMARIRKLTKTNGVSAVPKGKCFIVGALFLAILTGLLIPSTVISSSPQEFIISGYVDNPLLFIAFSFTLSLGVFVLWLGVFYWLGEAKTKLKYECFVATFCIIGIINYMIFGKNTSLLDNVLVLADGLQNSPKDRFINGIVVLAIVFVMHLFWRKYRMYFTKAFILGCIAMIAMTVINIASISDAMNKVNNKSYHSEVSPNHGKLVLSKSGKNVVVFMIDRAIGAYVPYILKEKPELKQAFDGFTYYNNVISYAGHTLFGSPAIFGGYEYTPKEMQKRKDTLLRQKHNESMLIMPEIFHQNGFDVTVANLPFVNYSWIPDYSVFKDYTYIRIEDFNTPIDAVVTPEILQEKEIKNKRNFFCYGLMKISPVVTHRWLYGHGKYNRFDRAKDQIIDNINEASAKKQSFMQYYKALEELPQRTKIVESGDTFVAMTNDITHEPGLLQLPKYVPSDKVDNRKIADYNGQNYIIDGKKLLFDNIPQVIHYQANMATFLKLAEWLEYLRDQGVYDNTRIILVADHGYNLVQLNELKFGSDVSVQNKYHINNGDAMGYFPLLMVKDFNGIGFKVSSNFMTNADVPLLAMKDIIYSPKNPFTGKFINDSNKIGEQYILASNKFQIHYNTGYQYQKSRWYAVKDNIWDKNNWRVAKEDSILPE